MEQTDKQKQVRSHIFGIAGTLLFHGLLILLFILFIFHTPIPPWPEEGGGGGGSGLEINLGNSDDGMYADESTPISIPDFENNKVAEPVEPPMEQDIKSANTNADDILAQDNEESVAVPAKPENVKKDVGLLFSSPCRIFTHWYCLEQFNWLDWCIILFCCLYIDATWCIYCSISN